MRITSSIVVGVLILNPGSAKANGSRCARRVNEVLALQGNAPAKKHAVTLNWKPSAGTVAGYNVYRSTDGKDNFHKINKSSVSECKYVDADVESGKTYHYLVRATDGRGHESANSTEITVVVP